MYIHGAFLHADLDEELVMLLRGQLADLMVQVGIVQSISLKKGGRREYSLHDYMKMLKAVQIANTERTTLLLEIWI
jgi:hypothetical protein